MTKTATKEKKENTTNKNLMFINKVKINNDNTAAIYYRTTCDSNAQEVFYQGKDEVTEEFKKSVSEYFTRLYKCRSETRTRHFKNVYECN